MKTNVALLLLILGISTADGQRRLHSSLVKSHALEAAPQEQQPPAAEEWTERKITAVILSTIIPGAGQAYLGHSTKGAAFTVGAFGSGLVTILAENNVVGRSERLDELFGLYQQAIKYDTAQYVWEQILKTKNILDDDVKRRAVFRTLTIAFWTANIVDVIFFTDDRGTKSFTTLYARRNTTVALVPNVRNGLNAELEIRF